MGRPVVYSLNALRYFKLLAAEDNHLSDFHNSPLSLIQTVSPCLLMSGSPDNSAAAAILGQKIGYIHTNRIVNGP
jgi:hypothetical protein